MERVRIRMPSYGPDIKDLVDLVPAEAKRLAMIDAQKAIPAIAKDEAIMASITHIVRQLPTYHDLVRADSREMTGLADNSIHLVVTSPPYWNLKKYAGGQGQLGDIGDYEAFLDELDKVWHHALRLLVPGGRMAIVVGDVCVPRRTHGRHLVYPLHSSIQERCRKMGFDNLAPIVWHKITNAKFEAGGGSILGKPYEPGAVVKNDIEFILFQRKPGGYRQPTLTDRIFSVISERCHREWFQQVWSVPGASTRDHPAPYPLGLAERLIRMFSFVGDTVMDPFLGTGTTSLAASRWGRNSIGFEVEPSYFEMSKIRLDEFNHPKLDLVREGRSKD